MEDVYCTLILNYNSVLLCNSSLESLINIYTVNVLLYYSENISFKLYVIFIFFMCTVFYCYLIYYFVELYNLKNCQIRYLQKKARKISILNSPDNNSFHQILSSSWSRKPASCCQSSTWTVSCGTSHDASNLHASNLLPARNLTSRWNFIFKSIQFFFCLFLSFVAFILVELSDNVFIFH